MEHQIVKAGSGPEGRLVQNLIDSRREGWKRVRAYRRKRAELVREYLASLGSLVAGNEMDEDGKRSRRPYNVLYQGVTAFLPQLVGKMPNPRVHARTARLKPTAVMMEEALRHINDRQDFYWTLRNAVLDSFFGPGIIYTGIDAVGEGVEEEGHFYDQGEVYSVPVSVDDLVIDPHTRRLSAGFFMGHRFTRTLEGLTEMEVFGEEFLNELYEIDETARDYTRVEDLTKREQNTGDANEFGKRVWIEQLWLPHHELIVFMPSATNDNHDPSLAAFAPYFGPEEGPYDVLGFDYAPDSPLPMPMTGSWLDMHSALNTVAGKMIDQAYSHRDLIAAPDQETLDRVSDANHLGMVKMKNTDELRQFTLGGVSKQTIESVQILQQMSSFIQGNTEMMAGIRSNAKTATEAEILAQFGGGRLADMQLMVERFTNSIMRKRAWHLWPGHNPLINLPLTKSLGGPYEMRMTLNSETAEGNIPRLQLRDRGQLHDADRSRLDMRRKNGSRADCLPGLADRAGDRRSHQRRRVHRNHRARPVPAGRDASHLPQSGVRRLRRLRRAGAQPDPAASEVKVGRPGSPGFQGRTQTGKSSQNFDRSGNTQKRREASKPQTNSEQSS